MVFHNDYQGDRDLHTVKFVAVRRALAGLFGGMIDESKSVTMDVASDVIKEILERFGESDRVDVCKRALKKKSGVDIAFKPKGIK